MSFICTFSVIVTTDVNQQTENNVCGIWYAGIVVFGKEYAFSQAGVESTLPVRKILILLEIYIIVVMVILFRKLANWQ